MATVTQSVDVNVDVRTAYNQWTQFETFPSFMEGVEEVRQIDDTHLHWRTSIGGVERQFDAEITDQEPDQKVAWHSLSGPEQAGVVTFDPLGADRTRVNVELAWQPDGLVEKAGSALQLDDRRVKGDLERFKEFIERRGTETGAWRGEV